MANIALLTAAGNGTRMHQDIPKQFLHVRNKPIIIYTMEAFQKHPNIDEIVVVCLEGWHDILYAYSKQFGITKLKAIVSGGSCGQESIYNGLAEINKSHNDDDLILVHDGNRPMVSQEIISDSIAKCKKYGDAVAAIPCTEVVFRTFNGKESMEEINREEIVRTQTPHTYSLGKMMWAHNLAAEKKIYNTSASCSLMRALGEEIHFSKGEEKNIKITTTEDLEIFQSLLDYKNESWIKM